jgi:hypothetical protein
MWIKNVKIFGLVLLAAALLYLPALPLTNELTQNLPKKDWQLRPPEIGILPFLTIYWGAIIAVVLLWQKKNSEIMRTALWVAVGGAVQGLLLPILGRGWEGFLLWFNPALLLVTLVMAGLGLLTGVVWGIACYRFSNLAAL